SKAEKSSTNYLDLLKKLSSEEAEETPAKKVIQRLVLKTVGERDYSAQEVMHILMGWPMHSCSRKFVTLSIGADEGQHFAIDADNESIRQGQSMLQKYRKRPVEVQELSLMKFAKWHNIQKGKLTRN